MKQQYIVEGLTKTYEVSGDYHKEALRRGIRLWKKEYQSDYPIQFLERFFSCYLKHPQRGGRKKAFLEEAE